MQKENFNKDDLVSYINNQLNSFFPDSFNSRPVINKNISLALERITFSLKHVKLPGYTVFSHLHSDLYAQFIYFLSNSIWTNDQDKITAGKLFYLNKALHGLNCMYDTVMPDIFLLIHCVGSVLGKATYGNYFVACHNVTVGSDKGNSPVLNEGVYMGPGSSIVGNCIIGKYTHMTINSVLLDRNTAEGSLIIGSSPRTEIRKIKRNLITEQYFSRK